MNTTLATINGEVYAVPGLTFWGKRTNWGTESRVALICSDRRGAVEVWTCERYMTSTDPLYRSLGGVEIHSPVPMYGEAPDDAIPDCEILHGSCFTDGSSLAYGRTFLPMIDRGDHAGVLRELAGWHNSHFGPLTEAQR